MNVISDAIDKLTDILTEATRTEDAVSYVNSADKYVLTAAIDALKKQIPTPPVEGYQFGEKMRKALLRSNPEIANQKAPCCPVCGRSLKTSSFVKARDGKEYGDPYCPYCGQRIKWDGDGA